MSFREVIVVLTVWFFSNDGYTQVSERIPLKINIPDLQMNQAKTQFIATSNLIDAALNSLNSINGLVKKENYRNKITSFNNPANAEMGFSLENEIRFAMKPILDKTKNTNTKKFSDIISLLLNSPVKNQLPVKIYGPGTIFSSLLSFVGNLAIHEKKITREDVDTFVLTIGKYFAQYEKLKEANNTFDANIDKFNIKLQELQFDIREFMLDLVNIIYTHTNRSDLRLKSLEEILLKYLDESLIATALEESSVDIKRRKIYYPGDGIKTAKEIVYGIQKLFNEYQKLYAQNYSEIKAVLLQTKELGKHINTRQVDQAILEFDLLYKESKDADILNLRLTTLSERLKYLVSTESIK